MLIFMCARHIVMLSCLLCVCLSRCDCDSQHHQPTPCKNTTRPIWALCWVSCSDNVDKGPPGMMLHEFPSFIAFLVCICASFTRFFYFFLSHVASGHQHICIFAMFHSFMVTFSCHIRFNCNMVFHTFITHQHEGMEGIWMIMRLLVHNLICWKSFVYWINWANS